MAAKAKIKIRIRKISTKLLVTCGSSLSRFATRERYVVITLSTIKAMAATIAKEIMVLTSKPNKLGAGVGLVTLIVKAPLNLLLAITQV
jgi:hypothetical protein